MRKPAIALVLGLLAVSLVGCGEAVETSPSLTAASSTTTSDDRSSSLYGGITTSGAAISTTTSTTSGSSNSMTNGSPATQTSQLAMAPDPLAGKGISATLVEQTPHSWFSRNLDAKVSVVNHDAVARSGYVIATFSSHGSPSDLQYRYITLAPRGTQTMTLSSTKPADDASIDFRSKFL